MFEECGPCLVLYSGCIKKKQFLTILATISFQKRTPCQRIIYSKQTSVPCCQLVVENNKVFNFFYSEFVLLNEFENK